MLISLANVLFGQSVTIETVKNAYQSFNYEEVIASSKVLLESKTKLSLEERSNVFTMTAVALYSLNRIEESRINFIELLKLNANYELNPTLISPKIIDFFNSIKNDFKQIVIKTEENTVNTLQENQNEPEPEIYISKTAFVQSAMAKSILLPGLGHFDLDMKTKGWLLSSSSALLLGGVVYSVIETNSREEKYLSETNLNLIPQKYDLYNEMYKVRNILISAYIAVWIYSQIDLLLFRDELPNQGISFLPSINLNNSTAINFSLKVKL